MFKDIKINLKSRRKFLKVTKEQNKNETLKQKL